MTVGGPWHVSFDPQWRGPKAVDFHVLQDWTARPEPGIKYYSGSAIYRNGFAIKGDLGRRRYLDLGAVKHLAEVTVNGRRLGVIWTAPWRIDISNALKEGTNELEIAVTNVWANRLIGDEQQPSDCLWSESDQGSGSFLKEFPEWFLKGQARPSRERYTFTTWNYFTKDSPLEPSGLMGPVTVLAEE